VGSRNRFIFLLASWLCIVFLAGGVCFGAEGAKILKFGDTTITVPSMAPDFTSPDWEAAVLGSEHFPLGSTMLAMVINPGKTVRVIVLLVRRPPAGKPLVVAFSVEYPGKSAEFFEDYQYATTGKPSGVFVRCKGDVMERYSRWLQGSGI